MTQEQKQDQEQEIWKPITDCNGYEVSNLGRVRSYRSNSGKIMDKPLRFISSVSNTRGYPKVTITDNHGGHRCRTIHCLVAQEFLGPRPEGMQVCHNDGSKNNNRVSNLRYDTQFGNMLDAINQDRIRRGGDINTAVMDEHDVIVMRRIHKRTGFGQLVLSRLFGISEPQAQNIIHYKQWKHLP